MKIKISTEKQYPQLEQMLSVYKSTGLCMDMDDSLPHLYDLLETGLVAPEINASFKHKMFSAESFHFDLFRSEYIPRYGFVLLSQNLVDNLSHFLKDDKVVDIGAGTGFLASQLKNQNIDITAVELQEQSSYGFANRHIDIIYEDALTHLKNHTYDSVLLTWPNYDTEFATEILSSMSSGQRLYYNGERQGGCTASASFFKLLEEKAVLNDNITDSIQEHTLQWSGLHDDWYVYDIK